MTPSAGTFDHGSIRIVLGGTELVPESVSNGRLVFRIPDDADGDLPMFLRSGELESNTLLFSVSDEIAILAPELDDWIETADGTRVVRNMVLIFVEKGRDADAVAAAAAAAEGGEVVGRIAPMRARQIRLPTLTYNALLSARNRLEAMDGISDVLIDFEVPTDAAVGPGPIDWSQDQGRPGQRESNRVEEGAQLYVDHVHPTRPGSIIPYFRSIGVYEAGVHFSLNDFTGFASTGGSRSGNIALYASDLGSSGSKPAMHGSNVTGLFAAELGDGRAAGLLRALGEKDAHGGFNIRVSQNITNFTILKDVMKWLKSGADVINISAGVHKCDDIENFKDSSGQPRSRCLYGGPRTSQGTLVDNNLKTPFIFSQYQKAFEKIVDHAEGHYPNSVIVVSAGNGDTDAGDRTFRTYSSRASKQVLVVGAHEYGAISGRAYYSNYGERVDIAAAGAIFSSFDGKFSQGTSYATPLVAATVAAMRSIDPDLTPQQILGLLRASALPVSSNDVLLKDPDGKDLATTVFTRPLTAAEVGGDPDRVGKGARLNVEGAIQAAIDSRGKRTRREGPRVDVVVEGQKTVQRTVSVFIPLEGAVFDRVDIVFLVDVSGSYGSSLGEFRRRAVDLVRAFQASGSNVYTGLASFSDFPISPWGSAGSRDYAFRLDQALSADGDSTVAAINRLALSNGADTPESQLEALYQLASGTGRSAAGTPAANIPATTVGWRDGSLRIVFLATDANFHNPEGGSAVQTSGYPGASWSETVAALNAGGIRVFGLERGSAVSDVRALVQQTSGEVFHLDSASSQIVEAVQAALEGVSASMDLSLLANGDFARLIKSINPNVVKDVKRGDTINFEVSFARGDGGKGEHTFVFRLEAVAEGTAIIEEIPVVVTLK
ncbi:MAG: S8 family serine peptidase [Burkholderiales bacterium]|nr:S8 family serine peptidase [Burkholderiales bacterium]